MEPVTSRCNYFIAPRAGAEPQAPARAGAVAVQAWGFRTGGVYRPPHHGTTTPHRGLAHWQRGVTGSARGLRFSAAWTDGRIGRLVGVLPATDSIKRAPFFIQK
jgi:hypothetical protein